MLAALTKNNTSLRCPSRAIMTTSSSYTLSLDAVSLLDVTSYYDNMRLFWCLPVFGLWSLLPLPTVQQPENIIDSVVHKCCPDHMALEQASGELCLPYDPPPTDDPWFPLSALHGINFKKKVPKLPPGFDSTKRYFEPCPVTVLQQNYILVPTNSTELTFQLGPQMSTSKSPELQVLNVSSGEILFSSSVWCSDVAIDNSNKRTGIRVLACPCIHTPCVSLCCYQGRLIDVSLISSQSLLGWCVQQPMMTNLWGPWNLTSKLGAGVSQDNFYFKNIDLTEYAGECHSGDLIHTIGNQVFSRLHSFELLQNFTLQANGSLTASRYELVAGEFCVGETLLRGRRTTVALVCDSDAFVISPAQAFGQSLLASVGALFSLAALVVCGLAPSLNRGIKGISLTWHCACMLLAYICLALRPLTWSSTNTASRGNDACFVLAIVTQFSLLSAFFWLNIRAIIIHVTFRSLGSMLSGLGDRSAWWFSLYALGIPALISGLTAWAEASHDKLPSWMIPPGIDTTACWFMSPEGRAIYFSAPMGLLLLVNGILFVGTMRDLIRARNQEKELSRTGPSNDLLRSDFRRLRLYAKLFFLMGLTWSAELFSWINYLYRYYWYISNVAIVFRAVLVFVIFCCTKRVWQELKERHPGLCLPLVLFCKVPSQKPSAVFYTQQPDTDVSSENKTTDMSLSKKSSSTMTFSQGEPEILRNEIPLHQQTITEEDEGIEVETPVLITPPERASTKFYLNDSFLPELFAESSPQSRRRSSPSQSIVYPIPLADVPIRGIRGLCARYNEGHLRLSRFLRGIRVSVRDSVL